MYHHSIIPVIYSLDKVPAELVLVVCPLDKLPYLVELDPNEVCPLEGCDDETREDEPRDEEPRDDEPREDPSLPAFTSSENKIYMFMSTINSCKHYYYCQ